MRVQLYLKLSERVVFDYPIVRPCRPVISGPAFGEVPSKTDDQSGFRLSRERVFQFICEALVNFVVGGRNNGPLFHGVIQLDSKRAIHR